MTNNNIDTFIIRADAGTYNAEELMPTSKFDHIHAWIDRKKGDLRLRVSAKVLKTPNDLGSITTYADIEKLPSIIKANTG